MDFCNVIALAPAEWLGSPGRSSHPQTLAGGGGVTRRALSEIPTSTSSVPLGDHARLATRSAGGGPWQEGAFRAPSELTPCSELSLASWESVS